MDFTSYPKKGELDRPQKMTFPHQLVDPSQEKKAESERSNKHPIRMRKRCLLFFICKTDQVIARDDRLVVVYPVRGSAV